MDRVLEDAEESERVDAKRLLGLLTVARRSLAWHEIQGFYSINLEDKSVNFDDRKLCIDSKELCGSLLEIGPTGVISFVHSSAKQSVPYRILETLC